MPGLTEGSGNLTQMDSNVKTGYGELEVMEEPYDWEKAFAQNQDQSQPGDSDFDVPPELMTRG